MEEVAKRKAKAEEKRKTIYLFIRNARPRKLVSGTW